MSQDGPQLPNIDVWRQIIQEVQPKLVITTGTAGGIGKEFEVGDVIVSPIVRFDCIAKFKKQPSHRRTTRSAAPKTKNFAKARTLFKGECRATPAGQYSGCRRSSACRRTALTSSVVTTDFFGFDTSDDHYQLQGLGNVSEMGDAVLGLVAHGDGRRARRAGSPSATSPTRRSRPRA